MFHTRLLISPRRPSGKAGAQNLLAFGVTIPAASFYRPAQNRLSTPPRSPADVSSQTLSCLAELVYSRAQGFKRWH